ncbi:LLM class F420-dependent oxidoreductase [Siccirubricoccus sp. KC 17139]|uniref:LLM class F420-dependent oxidoreductase n=1 Tax=Siccirubricoccus soli TaxID=2899147 RepID=A0ABT1D7N9_9PROT|nr:LLM class F420-dependent oxidoreductase [Siccirubricoccus soli]MCO6417937.1 LLM class F420-dependent oxidoreductase [Siccirubricoccus soli]MCP2684072.1 LLM class F420-dependent oxidoreductase [Siccirubricoccus soli]
MRLGVMLPLSDIGGAPAVVRDFALAAEEIGFTNLGLADHVLGVNAASRPDWGDRNTSADLFHDPFVCFGFLAALCRGTTEFSTQVLILAQRQAALVAKQAACLDVLCDGRFRLGVGVGWNPVEFTALNENFHNRGRRSAEQVRVMQALWAEPHVTFEGRWHKVEDAGINPLPVHRRVPVWFGGHVEQTLERIATLGDGWIMNAYGPGPEIEAAWGEIRRQAEAAGRDPAQIGLEVWISGGGGDEASWAEEARYWKRFGATHLTLTNTFNRRRHKRIPGRSVAEHLAVMRRFHDAVAGLA